MFTLYANVETIDDGCEGPTSECEQLSTRITAGTVRSATYIGSGVGCSCCCYLAKNTHNFVEAVGRLCFRTLALLWRPLSKRCCRNLTRRLLLYGRRWLHVVEITASVSIVVIVGVTVSWQLAIRDVEHLRDPIRKLWCCWKKYSNLGHRVALTHLVECTQGSTGTRWTDVGPLAATENPL